METLHDVQLDVGAGEQQRDVAQTRAYLPLLIARRKG